MHLPFTQVVNCFACSFCLHLLGLDRKMIVNDEQIGITHKEDKEKRKETDLHRHIDLGVDPANQGGLADGEAKQTLYTLI